MKRLHVHVGVDNLDSSIAFYNALFDTEPSVTKADYAKWMLDDPRVNFAISTGDKQQRGVQHLGIQTENAEELATVYGRLETAGQPVLEEGDTVCCYAKSEKSWISDPDGVAWETFLTHGDAVHYGDRGPTAEDVAAVNAETAPSKPAACCG